jgi:hypothetical protein
MGQGGLSESGEKHHDNIGPRQHRTVHPPALLSDGLPVLRIFVLASHMQAGLRTGSRRRHC